MEVSTTGWYQPLMLNHLALQRMKASFAAYGVRDTCRAFDVTHDVGFGVFAWMFGLYHVQIPQVRMTEMAGLFLTPFQKESF